MRILVTGGSGQVGFELLRALAPLGELLAPSSAQLDLADPEALREGVRRLQPGLIVNPAAYTAVDRAESEPERAFAINATAPGVLGEEARRLGIPVVHFSTDYVFSGEGRTPHAEADATAPRSVYGCSKLEGEQRLAAANPRHLVLRTSWVFGVRGNNFARTMLRLAGERDSLRVVDDQIGAPTSAALLADVCAHLVREVQRQDVDGFDGYGLYHLCAGGETSWHGYARFVIGEALTFGHALRARPETVEPISTVAYPTPAARPLNSRLDTTRLRVRFGLRLPDWQDGVRHVLKVWS
jgi:dTDP-4-dehydrorhamnose reductase